MTQKTDIILCSADLSAHSVYCLWENECFPFPIIPLQQRSTHRQMDGQKDGWNHGWMDTQKDGGIDWISCFIYICILFYTLWQLFFFLFMFFCNILVWSITAQIWRSAVQLNKLATETNIVLLYHCEYYKNDNTTL